MTFDLHILAFRNAILHFDCGCCADMNEPRRAFICPAHLTANASKATLYISPWHV